MKIFRNIAMLASAVLMLAAVSSCEEKTEETDVFIYSASGNLSASSQDATAPVPTIADYNDAITGAVGDTYLTESRDAEVISACDAVYEDHQALISSGKVTASGKVEIRKVFSTSSPSEEAEYTVVKTYEY